MAFESTTIKESVAARRERLGIDEEKIKTIINNIGKIERTMDLAEYNKKQIEWALEEPNKDSIIQEYQKERGHIPDNDDEIVLYFLEEADNRPSASELFAIENMQYRKDETDEELKEFYSKYL